MSYKNDLKIDTSDLEYEWARNPTLFDKWGKKWAIAQYKMERAKSKRELIKATISKEVRDKPGPWGWKDHKPPTNDFINQCTQLDPRFIKADRKYNRAAARCGVYEIARDSMFSRRKSLEGLTSLYAKQYYTGDGSMSEEMRKGLELRFSELQAEHLDNNPRMKRLKEKNYGTDEGST